MKKSNAEKHAEKVEHYKKLLIEAEALGKKELGATITMKEGFFKDIPMVLVSIRDHRFLFHNALGYMNFIKKRMEKKGDTENDDTNV